MILKNYSFKRGLFLLVFSLTIQGIIAQQNGQNLPINNGYEIKFEHPLPAMHVEGRHNGLYNNPEIGLPSILTTLDYNLGEMMRELRNAVFADRRLVFIDGKMLMCSNNWIRDHVHEMKGFCHWEYDLRSFIDFIIDHQRPDGCFYELIKQIDDVHWKYVDKDDYILYPNDNLSLVRLEIEADIEYLVVEGAMRYYQVTGDDEWLRTVLPKLEKGIDYVTSDDKRWDKEHGLVKRGFTIDTWDFTYKPGAGTNRRINADTPMGIMHGDNSGVFQAMQQLAWINQHFGNASKAKEWENRAKVLKKNMMKYLWNGKFFIHQLPLGNSALDDKENVRLSLSNTYDMNRGLLSVAQCRSIIEEYMRRRNTTKAFAEWFSIDPPYQEFGGHKPGNYVNGAISPFTAGELAKAAFNNGYEKYGWDIIQRLEDMVQRDKTIYFLYSPEDGAQQGGGPSAWGAAAILSAIDEGLAGVKNVGCGYDDIEFSPRFPVTAYNELRYITGYEVNRKVVDVRYILTDKGMRYNVISPAKHVHAHILIPKGKTCRYIKVNGNLADFKKSTIGDSHYVDMDIDKFNHHTFDIELFFN